MKTLPRKKGSKTGHRHTPHPLIQVHKHDYIETLEDFCDCIFPRNSFEVAKVLEATKQGKLGYGRMQTVAEELGIDYNKFNAIVRRLKDLGILTRNYTFSEVFQNKIAAICTFYGQFTGKTNLIQKALDDANEYLRVKGYSGSFKPRFEVEGEAKSED